MVHFAWCAAFISSLCTMVSLVWALDKHWYVQELSQQVVQLHSKVSQEHQERTRLELQNQRLRLLLKEYQELDKVKLLAKNTGKAQLLGVNNDVQVMLEPHGGLRYTSK